MCCFNHDVFCYYGARSVSDNCLQALWSFLDNHRIMFGIYSCSNMNPLHMELNESGQKYMFYVWWADCLFLLKSPTKGSQNSQHSFCTMGEVYCSCFFPHHVQKMNIYESRKVVPDGKMHSAARPSDSWPMPEEAGRQKNKSRQWGCDSVTKDQPCAVNIFNCVKLCLEFVYLF